MKKNIDKETGFSIPLAKEFEIFDLFKLKNRTAIITGSANGIGRIAAVALGKAGANIAITDIDFPAAKDLEEELSLEGIKCKSYLMDAAKENNIKETFSKIDKDLGDVDILVNNAGAAHRSASEDMSTENFENIIKLNLTGSFICAKTAAKRMLKNTAVTASLCMSGALAKCQTALSLLASLLLLKRLPRKRPSVVVLGVSR